MQIYDSSKRRVTKDRDPPSSETKQLARFRTDWDFPRMIASLPHGSRDYFTSHAYFTRDTKFTTRTLRAFEKLAELVPEAQREAKLKELGIVLCSRRRGRKRDARSEDQGWSIGGTDEQKDKNLRLDVKTLTNELESTFEDSEEEDEQTAHNKTAAHVGNERSTNKTRAKRSASRTLPVADEEHSNEEHQAIITAISENWLSWPIAEYLPRHAVPIGRYVADWPFDLLQAVLELSRATAGRDEEVRDRLAEEFRSPPKKFSHQRSLDNIKAVRDWFNGKSKMARTESSSGGPAGDVDAVVGPSTEQTSPSQPGPAAKAGTSSTAKATPELRRSPIESTTAAEPSIPTPTPQSTHKRIGAQDSTSEPPPKRAKHAAEERNAAAAASPTHAPASVSIARSESTRVRRYSSGDMNMQIIVAEFNKVHAGFDKVHAEFSKVHARLDQLAEAIQRGAALPPPSPSPPSSQS
ncbi:hypothetical protein N0V95_005837 [Ascochyta clinopodiicola]|nr:hypothetical protein N0V95_005837 [Ascochyta clinopodiicola]